MNSGEEREEYKDERTGGGREQMKLKGKLGLRGRAHIHSPVLKGILDFILKISRKCFRRVGRSLAKQLSGNNAIPGNYAALRVTLVHLLKRLKYLRNDRLSHYRFRYAASSFF